MTIDPLKNLTKGRENTANILEETVSRMAMATFPPMACKSGVLISQWGRNKGSLPPYLGHGDAAREARWH